MQDSKDDQTDTTVRVDIELHQQLKILAAIENRTLKDLIEEAIQDKINQKLRPPA